MIAATNSLVPGCAECALTMTGLPRGERGGCVAAGDGECQREVAGTEDGDRADGEEHGADVGPRVRFPVGQCCVNTRILPGAFLDEGGEETELTASAPNLSL